MTTPFQTYKEAREHLQKVGHIAVMMREDGHGVEFLTAGDAEEIEYAESLGWMSITETRNSFNERVLFVKKYAAFRFLLNTECVYAASATDDGFKLTLSN